MSSPSVVQRDASLPPFDPIIPQPPQAPTQVTPLYAPITPPLPHDQHLRRGQDEYWWALSALLPQGIAWPREPDTVLQKVVRGLAGIMGWFDGRAADLLERESDPRTTVEMLDSWERAFGLPDPCWYPHEWTVGERQTILVQRMTILGSQSRDFFINDVAAFLGYGSVSIREYRPFMAGLDRAGDNRQYFSDGSLGLWPAQIGPPTMRFAWTMHVPTTRLTWFRAGKGRSGTDAHLFFRHAEDLECVVRRWAPAHTVVLFDYSGVLPYGDPYAGTGEVYDGMIPAMLYTTPDTLYTPPPYVPPEQP
jgi:uncharacterized protein YmfQ (DUF2313 family)